MSFFKKDKKKNDAKPASPRGGMPRKGSSGNLDKGRTTDKSHTPKSSPSLSNSKPQAKPSPSQKKPDDEDDFWGEKNSTTPPVGGAPATGMPATGYPPTSSFQVPPGYIFQGFALDQFGQTVMVMLHALSGQQFYQPVPPSLVQQYTGFQGNQGTPMSPPMSGYPSTSFQGGATNMGYPQSQYGSTSPQSFYPPTGGYPQGYGAGGMPTSPQYPPPTGGTPQGGSYAQPPTGYQPSGGTPQGGGYPSSYSPQQNGGSYAQSPTTTQGGYPQQSGGSYVSTQPSQPSYPQQNGGSYVSTQPSQGYPQQQGAYLSASDPARERSASDVGFQQQQPVGDGRGLLQSADSPVPVPPRPAHLRSKENRTPTLKREILINQHRFGEEFGKLSVMREARRKAREEERKKTGGIKVLPTIKNPGNRKEEEKKRKEAIKKAEEERRKRDMEAKIQREAEERAKMQEEAMLRDIEERVKREEEERRRAWEEEMRRKKAEEERQWAEEEARVLAQLEEEKRKRLDAEEKIKLEKEKKKKELEELQKIREQQRQMEEHRKQQEEQRALQERIEKEKSWAKQSFNPAEFKKQMELKLREEMEKQLREEQERLRKSESMVWEVRPEDVTTDKPLGKGAFGMVYSGKLRGKRVAIKTILVENLNEENIASFKKEVDIMIKLRHPNILLFMGACFQPGHFMLITELMPKGSLDKIIHEKKEPLTFKQRMSIARDTALGMNWLHNLTPPLLHLDLKLGNLLVDESWNVKVADFGLSKMKSDCVTEDEGFIGSPFYMAPEMLQEKEYNEKADVYSFGVVLWELYTMRTPYEGMFSSLEEFIDAIVVDEERPDMPPECPTTLHNLIESCWQTDPNLRPSFTRILEASLFELIIIEELVKDPLGKAMWIDKFLEEDVVSWDEFVEGFCDYFHVDYDQRGSDNARLKALKGVLVPQGKDSVTIEAFGNALAWFGPVVTGASLLDNAFNTISQPWFHGEMTREEAELQLKPKKEGTYLIRFSASTPGSFTLSIKHQKKKFVHLRISRTPEGQFEYNKQLYPSIHDFLSAHKAPLNLKTPCSGSPFQDLFGKPAHVAEGVTPYASGQEYGNFGQLTFS